MEFILKDGTIYLCKNIDMFAEVINITFMPDKTHQDVYDIVSNIENCSEITFNDVTYSGYSKFATISTIRGNNDITFQEEEYVQVVMIKTTAEEMIDILQKQLRVTKDLLEKKQDMLDSEVTGLKEQINPVIDFNAMTVNEAREYMIKKVGLACTATIFAGVDVTVSKGVQHFSYTTEDQNNLKVLFDTVMLTRLPAPYHADDNLCTVYPYVDIVKIYVALQSNLLVQTTYCNVLNTLIRRLENKEDILNVEYGQNIPQDLQISMDAALNQGNTIMDAVLKTAGISEGEESETKPSEII